MVVELRRVSSSAIGSGRSFHRRGVRLERCCGFLGNGLCSLVAWRPCQKRSTDHSHRVLVSPRQSVGRNGALTQYLARSARSEVDRFRCLDPGFRISRLGRQTPAFAATGGNRNEPRDARASWGHDPQAGRCDDAKLLPWTLVERRDSAFPGCIAHTENLRTGFQTTARRAYACRTVLGGRTTSVLAIHSGGAAATVSAWRHKAHFSRN